MTVSELIEKLKDFPPHLEVCIEGAVSSNPIYDVQKVIANKDPFAKKETEYVTIF